MAEQQPALNRLIELSPTTGRDALALRSGPIVGEATAPVERRQSRAWRRARAFAGSPTVPLAGWRCSPSPPIEQTRGDTGGQVDAIGSHAEMSSRCARSLS